MDTTQAAKLRALRQLVEEMTEDMASHYAPEPEPEPEVLAEEESGDDMEGLTPEQLAALEQGLDDL